MSDQVLLVLIPAVVTVLIALVSLADQLLKRLPVSPTPPRRSRVRAPLQMQTNSQALGR